MIDGSKLRTWVLPRITYPISVVLRDAVIALIAYWLALLLRFEGQIPAVWYSLIDVNAPVIVGVLTVVGLATGMYSSIPKYTSLREVLNLAGVVAITTAALLILNETYNRAVGHRALPISVHLIGSALMFLGLGAARVSPRLVVYMRRQARVPDARRVLIVGAGDAGEHVVRDMLRDSESGFLPVGFLDDDPTKIGRKIHGLPVVGPVSKLEETASKSAVDQVIIALPSAPSRIVREVVKQVSQSGLKVKILPSLGELMGEPVTSADVRDVDISDLMARGQVKVDNQEIERIFKYRTVLVTGAAGSIGSELARQAIFYEPSRVVLLDNNETELYSLYQRLIDRANSRGVGLEMVIADIRDRSRVDRVFDEYSPDLIFHAAAYKHVPVMELHPGEAIRTNVTGTRNVAEAAARTSVERFVLVSTDKAVNPASVMGATKRLAEVLVSSIARESKTIFSSVRFGNVFASRGSVVPIFAQQMREGGPITVTHPEATRYFMTIAEAVSLICQAASLGQGGETFVLEMGEPVRIMDLAERMRNLLGDESSRNVEIVVTGLRPGEKIHEDLWANDERLTPVKPGILLVKPPHTGRGISDVLCSVQELEEEANQADSHELVKDLFELVEEIDAPDRNVHPARVEPPIPGLIGDEL